jgi:succinate dehydrogenase/fumarate reductase flavoprotein subunit
MNTPGDIAWSIFDTDYPKYVQAQLPVTYERILDGLDKTLEEKVASGMAIKADTLEELAKKIGVPADSFLATVEHYNSMYAKGEDTDFSVPNRFLSEIKTAPFYATKNVASLLVIPFGLHVNDDSQVCTEDDEAIPGLFAIGNVQGDFFGLAYPVHCPGISHGRSITFGQLVGEALAKDTVITKTA